MMAATNAKEIAATYWKELGFVNLAALKEAEQKNTLEVIPGIGFCNYHHRRDRQTTIYEIAVDKGHAGKGWGRLLFYRVLCDAIEKKQKSIFAKCPVDLASNAFYEHLGFKHEGIEQGRKRQLNCWRYSIELPLLFFCGGGGKSKYDQIAKQEGWRLGIKSYEKNRSHEHMQMVTTHMTIPIKGFLDITTRSI